MTFFSLYFFKIIFVSATLHDCEKLGEIAFAKRNTFEHNDNLNKSLKNIVNISHISTGKFPKKVF